MPALRLLSRLSRFNAIRLIREMVLGPVPLAGAALVLAEAHVQLPVQVVLHRPVAPNGTGHRRGVDARRGWRCNIATRRRRGR